MNLIFVDFDGVLVPWRTSQLKRRPAIADPLCVERLNDLCRAVDGRIVATTHWRDGKGKCERILREWGCTAQFYGESPRLEDRAATRGMQIRQFLSEQTEYHAFVILDDEIIDGPDHFLEKWVCCLRLVGLSDSDVDLAKSILLSQVHV